VVLVPNHEILQQHVAETVSRLGDGEVCNSPAVYTLSSWVESAALQTRMIRGLAVAQSLDSWSGLMSWTRITSQRINPPGRSFLLSAAKQARAADRLINQWCLGDESLWLDEQFNAIRWRIGEEMKTGGLFTSEDWMTDLTELLADQSLPAAVLPKRISLKGFVEHTELENRLFGVLEANKVEVGPFTAQTGPARPKVREYLTPEDEWQAAARWAKSRIEDGAGRVAIVISDQLASSGQTSQRIYHALSAVFHPGSAAGLATSGIQDFCIQNASTLIENPAIADALLLIRISLAGSVVDQAFPDLSRLLLSPHWSGADTEKHRRAWLELQLRETGIFRNSLVNLCRYVHSSKFAPELEILIKKILQLPPVPDEPVTGSWFHQTLNDWGWPGEEHHVELRREIDQLGSVLETLSQMQFESYEQALGCLEMMLAETFLSSGGGLLSPVQVVSPEVAAAGHYDEMWVCHMDETSWPPPLTRNPYLPASALQAIPRLTPEGQFQYYQKLTMMLCEAADNVVFSWSAEAEHGPREMSPYLADFVCTKSEQEAAIYVACEALGISFHDQDRDQSRPLLAIDDEQGNALPSETDVAVPGGSGFFRMQAACPLAGYLIYRLSARFPAAPLPHASPAFRGELMHLALRELYSDARRKGITPQPGDVLSAVRTAMIRCHANDRLGPSAYRAEEKTLTALLKEWLTVEADRGDFEVDSLEETRQLSLGRMVLKVRPDRIDRLADHSFLVIDYKSGGAKSRALKWTRPRIQEPQLPLYAVLLEEKGNKGPPGGLTFAVIKPGQCGFDGICSGPDVAIRGVRIAGQKGRGGLPEWEWQSLTDHWKSQLISLGDEILMGHAQNQVYDGDIVQYSGVDLVLRHAEAERFRHQDS